MPDLGTIRPDLGCGELNKWRVIVNHAVVNPELARLLTEGPAIAHRDHRDLTGPIYHAVGTGELVKILPGVFVASGTQTDWRVLAVAACLRSPDVVITGPAALNLGLGTRLPVHHVDAFHPHSTRCTTRSPVVWHLRYVPGEWTSTLAGIRFSDPAWTAVDMCGNGDASPLDWALNRGVSLPRLWEAFHSMPNRPGNPTRRRLLVDSRDLPWSPAERLLHRLLRGAGITGWTTNPQIAGHRVDLAFGAQRLVIEVDGYQYHSSRTAFEQDRARDQDLAMNGWMVLRVTWNQLDTEPDAFLAKLVRILRLRRQS